MSPLPVRNAVAGMLATLLSAAGLPAQDARVRAPAAESTPGPDLQCWWNEQQDGLVLELWAPADRFHARVLATTSERVLPASESRPGILHSDLVIGSGQGLEGRLRLEIPAGGDLAGEGCLRLQGLLLTPEGEMLVTPIRTFDLSPAENEQGTCGVRLRRNAAVYAGSPCNCTQPATFDFERVRAATPEWRTILAEGVRPDSARYGILVQAMHRRIVAAAQRAARQLGCDLVVRAGDIADARGKQVVDLTELMMPR